MISDGLWITTIPSVVESAVFESALCWVVVAWFVEELFVGEGSGWV